MKVLYTEMLRRFPELESMVSEGDDELPYMMMNYLADWLGRPGVASEPANIKRVVAFVSWCETQPPGKNAGDDLRTILVVGLIEHLLESSTARTLVPHLVSREIFTSNADYFRHWVGPENYEQALRRYDQNT